MASIMVPHQGCVHVSSSSQSRPTVSRSVLTNPSRPISGSISSSALPAPQRCGGKISGALHPTTSRGCACRSSEELFTLAATGPSGVQDLLVSGAVLATVGAAVFAGLRKDPEPCDLCQGTGGCQCFGCTGDGKMEQAVSRDDMYVETVKRDMVGRLINPRMCRVCKGVGVVLCSQCKGNGYVTKFL